MATSTLPDDTSSLLVPIHLDAWVVDAANQQELARYEPDFSRLARFSSPLPDPFSRAGDQRPALGVHLHWALPDALTHGQVPADGGPVAFPLVPNRWLVARFGIDAGVRATRLWVIESDHLTRSTGAVGAVGADLKGPAVTTIPLDDPGALLPLAAGTRIELVGLDGQQRTTVVSSAALSAGDRQLAIKPQAFGDGLFPAQSRLRLSGSPFLDPANPTRLDGKAGEAPIPIIHHATLGTHHAIEEWQERGDSPAGQLFLQAVGPGNPAFAAYAPFVRNVFSFTDTDLPPDGSGAHRYSYLVVGWFSSPEQADPLRGVKSYLPGIWQNEAAWRDQSPAGRFQTLLAALRWSVQGELPASPPATSLYHGMLVGVEWPRTSRQRPAIDPSAIRIAVGNTSVDALAALIEAQAAAREGQPAGDALSGDGLAELIQAAMYKLLDSYGQPGGAAVVEQQIEQAWYGSQPGGTCWEVVAAVPQSAGEDAADPQLEPALAGAIGRALADLNQRQRDLDARQRQLESLQLDLYMLWWTIARAAAFRHHEEPDLRLNLTWKEFRQLLEQQFYPDLFNQVWDEYCAVAQARGQLPDPEQTRADSWAEANWRFTTAAGDPATLRSLGLALKASPAPRFWHPNDPVLLIAGLQRSRKHGEDGRYSADGSLTCRLPGQVISGVIVDNTLTISAQALIDAGVSLDPTASYTAIPRLARLAHEAFLVDPANAGLIAAALGRDQQPIAAALAGLLDGAGGASGWIGLPPLPFALRSWEQAWVPLFLEWDVTYYPIGAGQAGAFSFDDWFFDGRRYSWKGSGVNQDRSIGYRGRTLLTPQAPLQLRDTIDAYLRQHPDSDQAALDKLLDEVGSWDILSQSLGGLSDQLITLMSQETFPPPPCDQRELPCPRQSGPIAEPCVTLLIGDQYHAVPQLLEQVPGGRNFYPVRGGFLAFNQLQAIDAFGQLVDLMAANTTGGFQPIVDRALVPSHAAAGLPAGVVQLPPRLIQSARLDLAFLTNDASGRDLDLAGDASPICGWLLPNHLDRSLAVYDAAGELLGELLPLPAPDAWRPRPGGQPAPATPDTIANPILRAVVASIASQLPAVRDNLLGVIDATLWTVDPLGGRKDQFLSVLIGRPLAVVQARLSMSLYGNPAYERTWNAIVEPRPAPATGYQPHHQIGEVEELAFPVCLGSLELRDDGLIGYYLPDGPAGYSRFYAVHPDPETGPDDQYIRPILAASGAGPHYQGDLRLKLQRPGVIATMLLDPRGAVHAATGVLPVARATLPAHSVERLISRLSLTIQAGPIVAEPGTLRLPRPAEDHGNWTWLQASAAGASWDVQQIVDATDQARLPEGPSQLRDGWLQLAGLDPAEL